MALAGLAALLGLAALGPAPASAGQIVWQKGGEIWVMDDSGANQRKLIGLADAPGMDRLDHPHVHPKGSTIVFDGETRKNRVSRTGMCGNYPYQYSCTTYHYGYNGTGLYRWQDGTAKRLSPAPEPCFNCSSIASQPEIRGDGGIASAFLQCTGWRDNSSFTCTQAIANGWQFEPACGHAEDPSPNPAGGNLVAYVGCTQAGEAALYVGGAKRAGEQVVACDDTAQEDPSWSPSGDRIVVSEGGEEPGLWVYRPGHSGCYSGPMQHALVRPDGVSFNSPRYVDSDVLIFEADGDLWAISAGCNGCAFPADAVKLTTGGNNFAPAWTSVAQFGKGTTAAKVPDTKPLAGPPKRTRKRKATFKFKASIKGSKLQCRLDKGKWKRCSSPHTVKVKPGKHRFQARAVSAQGKPDKTPATWSWKVLRR